MAEEEYHQTFHHPPPFTISHGGFQTLVTPPLPSPSPPTPTFMATFFLVFKLFLLYLFAPLFAATFSAAAAGGDLDLLMRFKAGVGTPGVLGSWVSGGDPCGFSRVKCGGGAVVGVDLSILQVGVELGVVAGSLMRLEKVERLSLRSANVTGNLTVVGGGGCGGALAELDLSGNGVSGEFTAVASLVGACQSLKLLNLSGNRLVSPAQLPASSPMKLSLKSLDLSRNQISGRGVVQTILSGGGCAELEFLSLAGNLIAGAVSPAAFAGCGALQQLDLSGNLLAGGVPSLGDCGALQRLDLSANNFTGDVSSPLAGCRNLTFLSLAGNKFSGKIPTLPSSNLRTLILSKAGFEGEIPLELPTAACKTLVELDLSINHLRGSLPKAFTACASLETINLSNNNLSGEIPADTLSSMASLKQLNLSYNNFAGELPDSLLSTLPKLEKLDLSSNNVSGSIPPSLCGVASNSLKVLYLQNNRLAGTIPAAVSNCSELVSLDLSFNYLTGTIPSSIGSLTKLQDLILWLNFFHGQIPSELSKLKSLENLILDNNELTGPIPNGLSGCTNLYWVSLSSNHLSGPIPPWIGKLSNLAILKLGNNSFSGPIPPEIGDCKSLIWLDLNSNRLNGSIPPALAGQSGKIAVGVVTGMNYVYLKNDGSANCRGAGNLFEFGGIRPEQVNRVPTRPACNSARIYRGLIKPTFSNNGSMIFLDLSYNQLEGSIPKEVGTMYYLFVLNLGHNDLTGPIPGELGDMRYCAILDLSYNNLQSSIPGSLSSLAMLSEIDLSNNNLTGMIPQNGKLITFSPAFYANNSAGLCGLPLPACGEGSASNQSNSGRQRSHRRQASLAGSVAMGLLFSLFCIVGLVIIAVENKKRRRRKDAAGGGGGRDAYVDSRSQSVTASVGWKLTSAKEALSINLAAFDKPLRKLTFADLLEATNSFHNDSLIGSGGFGDVYKAKLKDGSVVAIKKLIHVSGQGDREFTAEMETIGRIKHRNLVPLLGYCKVGEERLLVYDYMKYGSLEDVLHDRRKAGIRLSWPARRKIAVGAGRGLAFLHHNCTPHIIHRDMKSSNVLLDENLEARVSDFGMARLMSTMDTHLSVSTLAGTPGYVPPEYYQSFRCSTKGDVYSYGVVLLELLTGRQPTDSSDFGDNNLVGWVKQHAKLKITDVFDPMLMKEDPALEVELLQHLKVACACLDDRPWRRPTMIQVMAMFKEIQAGNNGDSGDTGHFGVVAISLKEDPELTNHTQSENGK